MSTGKGSLANAIAAVAAAAGAGSSSASSAAANAPPLASIADMESLVIAIISTAKQQLYITPTSYESFEKNTDDMLLWEGHNNKRKHTQLQELPNPPIGLARVGTAGDGNCMLHAILFSLSPTYRAHDMVSRKYISIKFREVLKARMEELKEIANEIYAVIGGAAALEHIFETLQYSDNSQLDVQMGLLISRLYNTNFLAVQLQEDMTLLPVCETFLGYRADLPTILINYQGGAINAGGNGAPKSYGFMGGGHYEAIFAPVFSIPLAKSKSPTKSKSPEKRSKRKTKKAPTKTATVITLDEVRTQYLIPADRLEPIIGLFSPCGRLG